MCILVIILIVVTKVPRKGIWAGKVYCEGSEGEGRGDVGGRQQECEAAGHAALHPCSQEAGNEERRYSACSVHSSQSVISACGAGHCLHSGPVFLPQSTLGRNNFTDRVTSTSRQGDN